MVPSGEVDGPTTPKLKRYDGHPLTTVGQASAESSSHVDAKKSRLR